MKKITLKIFKKTTTVKNQAQIPLILKNIQRGKQIKIINLMMRVNK
jgi:hypothetical protein